MSLEMHGQAALLKPPTASWSSAEEFVNRLESDHIPGRLDRPFIQKYFNESTANALRQMTRSLGFVDESDRPTDLLAAVVAKNTRQYTWRIVLRAKYGEFLDMIARSDMTRSELDRVFGEHFELVGSGAVKGAAFLLNAAREAGLPVANGLTAWQDAHAPRKSAPAHKSSKSSPATFPALVDDMQNGGTGKSTTFSDGLEEFMYNQRPTNHQGGPYTPSMSAQMDTRATLKYLFDKLLLKLPPEDRWTAEQKQKWLQGLHALGGNVDILIDLIDSERDARD